MVRTKHTHINYDRFSNDNEKSQQYDTLNFTIATTSMNQLAKQGLSTNLCLNKRTSEKKKTMAGVELQKDQSGSLKSVQSLMLLIMP